jgi:hypothetical protein
MTKDEMNEGQRTTDDGHATPPRELAFAGTDELIDELIARSDTLIVAHVPLNCPGEYIVRSGGRLLALAGLSDVISIALRKKLALTERT